jgi:hypothetical protein
MMVVAVVLKEMPALPMIKTNDRRYSTSCSMADKHIITPV